MEGLKEVGYQAAQPQQVAWAFEPEKPAEEAYCPQEEKHLLLVLGLDVYF